MNLATFYALRKKKCIARDFGRNQLSNAQTELANRRSLDGVQEGISGIANFILGLSGNSIREMLFVASAQLV